MKSIHVRLTFFEMMLGTASNNKEVYSDYIASKAPDAPSREEEIATIGVEEYGDKQITVFSRDTDGTLLLWEHQIKGFFKSACSALQKCKGEEFSKESCKIKAFKKVIDTLVFVSGKPVEFVGGLPKDPCRKLRIQTAGEVGRLERPLRAQTAQGERISLATSETVPEGSTVDLWIIVPDAYANVIPEWLNYGVLHGIGQWRNAGYGRYTWERIED